MNQNGERRKFRRFEIPGGKIRYRKNSGASKLKKFSREYQLLNMSLGGLQILCDSEFRYGEEIVLQIQVPKEREIKLYSKVVWQKPVALSNDIVVGFEFNTFGQGKGLNPPEIMNVLRRLYARYMES